MALTWFKTKVNWDHVKKSNIFFSASQITPISQKFGEEHVKLKLQLPTGKGLLGSKVLRIPYEGHFLADRRLSIFELCLTKLGVGFVQFEKGKEIFNPHELRTLRPEEYLERKGGEEDMWEGLLEDQHKRNQRFADYRDDLILEDLQHKLQKVEDDIRKTTALVRAHTISGLPQKAAFAPYEIQLKEFEQEKEQLLTKIKEEEELIKKWKEKNITTSDLMELSIDPDLEDGEEVIIPESIVKKLRLHQPQNELLKLRLIELIKQERQEGRKRRAKKK
eukprot:TRINITY_DN869_c0_g8_i1.p1 TRINITY_DN869_c0_g8~~TRINITY_DN869_c0_g8_i1.p1  ORF type:complete len:277 (+),score=61.60 TRINITY_DN869_c0_g8_i1:206-1036(+)